MLEFRTKNDRGAALIVVLWLIVLLTLLATTVSAISLSHRKAAARYAESVENQEAADSAIRLTLLGIMGSSVRQRVPITLSSSMTLLGHTITVTIEKESGKIDLNTAPQALLLAAFAANGWQEADAKVMAARIVDWRDSDDTPVPFGAEEPDYRSAHRSYGPRNGSFESVDEVRQVIDGEKISPELMKAFTTYAHTDIPNVASASSSVRLALQWADTNRLADHRWIGTTDEKVSVSAALLDAGVAVEIGEILRIRACVVQVAAMACRVAVVRLTGDQRKPIQVFLWRSVSSVGS